MNLDGGAAEPPQAEESRWHEFTEEALEAFLDRFLEAQDDNALNLSEDALKPSRKRKRSLSADLQQLLQKHDSKLEQEDLDEVLRLIRSGRRRISINASHEDERESPSITTFQSLVQYGYQNCNNGAAEHDPDRDFPSGEKSLEHNTNPEPSPFRPKLRPYKMVRGEISVVEIEGGSVEWKIARHGQALIDGEHYVHHAISSYDPKNNWMKVGSLSSDSQLKLITQCTKCRQDNAKTSPLRGQNQLESILPADTSFFMTFAPRRGCNTCRYVDWLEFFIAGSPKQVVERIPIYLAKAGKRINKKTVEKLKQDPKTEKKYLLEQPTINLLGLSKPNEQDFIDTLIWGSWQINTALGRRHASVMRRCQ